VTDDDDDDHDINGNRMLIMSYLPDACDRDLSTDVASSFCIVTSSDDEFLSTTASDTTNN